MWANKALRCFDVLLEPGAVRAIASWPKFSITSFKMISTLSRQQIRPRTVIDVGANVGQFAIAAAMILTNVEIYSFEPVPDAFAQLKKNVRALPNVTVYAQAVGERSGYCSLNVNSYSPSSSILPLGQVHRDAFPGERELNQIDVEMTTLDAVFDRTDLKPDVLLKLDVQGYESHVLGGGPHTLERCDYVILESSFRPMYHGEPSFRDILRLMEQRNFKFMRPVGWLSEPRTGEILQLDALFERGGQK